MMKKLIAATAASLLLAGVAHAADKFTVQMKWVPQAQFAGYYVAAAKGYYKAEGLDVTIKPGGPDISPAQIIAGKGADVAVNWRVDRIREADVVFVREDPSHPEIPPTTRVVSLRSPDEDAMQKSLRVQ